SSPHHTIHTTLINEVTCSVCLDTLSDPVSIPCGHNFCLKCLTDYWDHSQVCSCPQCRHTFTTRPELNRNPLLNEVVKKLKKMGLTPSPPQSHNYAGPGDVECDACTGKKFRAVKSCLTCMASFCQPHLQPHCEIAAWKGHKLVDPDGNLKEKLCVKHQKSLEIFCRTDEMCICMMCVVTGHKGHEMVDLETEREEKEVTPTELVLCHNQTELPVTHSQMSSLIFFSLLSDFCPLTLDINTAHRLLHLSEGNQKVTSERTKAEYPDHPDRFDYWEQVVCREALTGTRCYWEVECTGESLRIGVAYKGLSRKGNNRECLFGNNDTSWGLAWCNSRYSVHHNNKETALSAPYSPRIGVYLDWPTGSLSFYSVSHTMTLLHRFKTPFTEPLYPGFGVWLNSSVTICHLTPGDH
uniref:Uncharacterized protein n=1 Tax=Erpetoichthys calabaricus TaxID=27687 RepID=A0A8C4SXX3_ERPCA